MNRSISKKLTTSDVRTCMSALPGPLFMFKIQPLKLACSAEFDKRLPDFPEAKLDTIFAGLDAFGVRELAVNVDCNGVTGDEDPMAHYIVHVVLSALDTSKAAEIGHKLGKAFKWSAMLTEPSVVASNTTLNHAAKFLTPILRGPVGEYWVERNLGNSNIALDLMPHYFAPDVYVRRPLGAKSKRLLEKLKNADGSLKLLAYGRGRDVREAILRTMN